MANVAPNPMVGAVLVYEDRIIGEGYHMQFGQAHAEVNCINSVKPDDISLIEKSTLYVSLEPCNHHGKTPPCTDLILRYKIPRVVIGCSDPFLKVNGTGIQRLRDAGVEVIEGILEKEAIELNRRFFTFHQKQRPYIILKWAQTADGFIGSEGGKPLKISNEITDRMVHRWRSEEAAIMVGTNTAISDNPSLTTRLWPGKNPVRVVVDWNLRIPATGNLLDGITKTIVINNRREELIGQLHYVKFENKDSLIPDLMKFLYGQNILTLMVEGGSILLKSFIDAGYWDEARVITNQSLKVEKGVVAPSLKEFTLIQSNHIASDEVSFYRHAK